MVCEYYILKVLHSYYKDTNYLDFELYRNIGDYYCGDLDEDEHDYKDKLNDY